MQALTPEENRDAQVHLDECAYCRAALSESFVDLAVIGMSAEQRTLPEGARERLMVRIAKTPQEAVAMPRTVTEFPAREERKAGLGWLGWVAAAAALAIAAYLGYGNFKLKEQLTENRAQIALLAAQADRAQELTDALTSPAAKQVTLTESKQPGMVSKLQPCAQMPIGEECRSQPCAQRQYQFHSSAADRAVSLHRSVVRQMHRELPSPFERISQWKADPAWVQVRGRQRLALLDHARKAD